MWTDDIREAAENIWHMVSYLAVGLVVLILFNAPIGQFFNEREISPYTISPYEVELPIRYERRGEDIFVSANFLKNDDCKFQRYWALGRRDGEVFVLDTFLPDGEQGDRPEGLNTLRVVVLDAISYSQIRIMTRHLCRIKTEEGEIVEIKTDAKMLSFTPSQIKAAEEEQK